MRLLNLALFILFNIYLIEADNRTESDSGYVAFESEKSETENVVPGGAREKSDDLDQVIYDDDEYDDSSRENAISRKSENSTESGEAFPNEVFLSLRNITADAATAFRSFTNRNDVVDLQASASDNLNVTANSTLGDTLEAAGINLRALRDAGHPPEIIEESHLGVYLPYKHVKIDTADLSDCALQGEWKPMGVAHAHLTVGGDASHQAEVLQSVGSYSVPNKVIPLWQQNSLSGSGQDLQGVHGLHNHKPSASYTAGVGGSGFGSGFGGSGGGHGGFGGSGGHGGFGGSGGHGGFGGSGGAAGGHAGFASGGGHHGGASLGHFQKIKSASMLAPPPVPPIIFGKKPGYWKAPKTKHKYFPGKGKRPSGYSGAVGFGIASHASHGSGGISGGFASGHLSHGGGGHSISGSSVLSGHLSHGGSGYGGGGGGYLGSSVLSAHAGHGGSGFGGGGGSGGGHAISAHSSHGGSGYGSGGPGTGGGHSLSGGAILTSNLAHGGAGYGTGGGDGGVVSISGSSGHVSHGVGAAGGHSISSALTSAAGLEEDVPAVSLIGGGASSGGSAGYLTFEGGSGAAGGHLGSDGGGGGGHLISGTLISSGQAGVATGGDAPLPEAAFLSSHLSHGNPLPDSTFSSSHINHGVRGGNSLPDAAFLSSHINQDFAAHGQGVPDDLSSSSTFTCGKNHDHNTNYHTATFQVADHDHPSSVDVLQYGGDAAVLIQSGEAPFHEHLLPERKHYKTWGDKGDAEASSSDTQNELLSQAAQLTGKPVEPEVGQTEAEQAKADDEEEPERHSYYHEITKVTKIPATSVGAVQYTYSEYETKPQSFSTPDAEANQEETEAEQPQIIRELEHLSNKFQLDLENPQKLFEDPPTQELAYHYPFHGVEHHEGGDADQGRIKEEGQEGITEFPRPIPQVNKFPVVYKRPPIKYIPRPGKPQFYQKTSVNYLQPKPGPVVVLRKSKPKHFVKKKQNYEVQEHSGERHRPAGEIFPPQKFPKQFHNPKPNFAVDRPKNGWRPGPNENLYQDYKYDHSHGKTVKKFKHKQKILAPVLIRRPVQKITPVIRVVEVSG